MSNRNQFVVGQSTSPGKRTTENQDSSASVIVDFEIGGNRDYFQVAVVSDGISGLPGGAEASRLTVNKIKEFLSKPSTANILERIHDAILEANRAIYQESLQKPMLRGMGATVVLVAIYQDQLYVAHVGDSRAYLIRNGTAYQLTRDHTQVQELVKERAISAIDAQVHPDRHRLSQRLGGREHISVDTILLVPGSTDPRTQDTPQTSNYLALQRDDAVLLCSDGLYTEVSIESVEQIIADYGSKPQQATDKLVELANNNGGRDNITAVILRRPASQIWRSLGIFLSILAALFIIYALSKLPGTLTRPEQARPITTPTQLPLNTESKPLSATSLTSTVTDPPTVSEITPTVLQPTEPVTDSNTPTPFVVGALPPPTKIIIPTETPVLLPNPSTDVQSAGGVTATTTLTPSLSIVNTPPNAKSPANEFQFMVGREDKIEFSWTTINEQTPLKLIIRALEPPYEGREYQYSLNAGQLNYSQPLKDMNTRGKHDWRICYADGTDPCGTPQYFRVDEQQQSQPTSIPDPCTTSNPPPDCNRRETPTTPIRVAQ